MLNALYSKLQSEGTGNGPLSAKTVRYIHTTVHKALEDAVDAGVLANNAAERAKPPGLLGGQLARSDRGSRTSWHSSWSRSRTRGSWPFGDSPR